MNVRMTPAELDGMEKDQEIACFKVVYDGPSRPMIETPTGRLLSISEFSNGRWVSYEREDRDCRTIVDALNWILNNGPNIIDREIL